MHSQVLKQRGELITSRMHHRSRSRVSFYVLLQLTLNQQRVAEVLYYLRVQLPAGLAMRLAVCKVFAARARRGVVHVVDPNNVQHVARAFSVDNLVILLAGRIPGATSATCTIMRLIGARYSSCSMAIFPRCELACS